MITVMQAAGSCLTPPSIASLPLSRRGGLTSTCGPHARRDASFRARGRQRGMREGNKIRVSVNAVYSTICASIGFTDDPRTSVVRKAHTLLLNASSLLVYQEVLKAPPAQHFLNILLLVSRSNFDETKLVSCYSELYRSLLLSGASSWEDFLLDAILAGANNPFAQSSKALSPSGEPLPSDGPQRCTDFDLRAAAASDLDCLQHLAVDDATLTGWVSLYAEVRPAWLAAVRGRSSESSTWDKKRITASTPAFPQMGFGFVDDRPSEPSHSADGGGETLDFDGICPGSGMVGLADASTRKEWRKAIGGLSNWSAAVDALASSYSAHGTGPAAFHTDLVWAGGKLGKARSFNPVTPAEECSESTWVKSELKEFFEDRSGNATTRHILVDRSPSLEAKESDSDAVRGVNLRRAAAESRAAGLRSVSVGRGEVKNVAALARALGQQPGLRFCVLIEDLRVQKGEDAFFALSDTMTSVAQPFPANVIVCASTTTRLPGGLNCLFQKKFASFNKVL